LNEIHCQMEAFGDAIVFSERHMASISTRQM